MVISENRFGHLQINTMGLISALVLILSAATRINSEYVGNFRGELQTQQGQAIYSIPIELPKGPNNIQPNLNMVYSSGGGNGPMGQGWGFDLISVITRCPQTIAQDGQVRGVRYDAEDRFCLDGQRLVAVDGTYGAAQSEYRTEVETYSKIKALGQQSAGPMSFTVWAKDGRILNYGTSILGQVRANGHDAIHQWNLEEISDRFGNTVRLKYMVNSISLAQIQYGTTSVIFNYNNRPDISIGYSNGGIISNVTKRLSSINLHNPEPMRQYKLRYHINGSGGSNQSLLSSINLCDIDDDCLRPLEFNYGSSSLLNETLPIPIKNESNIAGTGWAYPENPRIVRDMNGDGLADIVGFHHTCVKVALNDGNGTFREAQCWVNAFGYNFGWRAANHQRELGDIDGDGLVDVVGFYTDGVHVSFNTGSSLKSPVKLLDSFGYSSSDGSWRTASHLRSIQDVNGDGRSDIIGFFNEGVRVSLSKGRTFEPVSLWSNEFGYSSGSWRIAHHPRFLRDVDGDSLPDIVGFGPRGSVEVAINTGTSFNTAKIWLRDFTSNQGWRNEYHQRLMVDINADGLADIVAFGKDGVEISLSTGTKFTNKSLALTSFGYNTSPAYRVNTHKRFVADMTGDGLPDIIGMYNDGVYISRNTRNMTFSQPKLALSQFGHNHGWRAFTYPRHVIDINGDGISDIIGFKNDGVYSSINPNSNSAIQHITDSFGNLHSISYMSLPSAIQTGHYNKSYDTKYPNQHPVPPTNIVINVFRNKGNKAENTTSYFYADLQVDVSGRGSQGFRWTKEISSNNCSVEVEHEQEFPLSGRIKHVQQKTVVGGNDITISDNVIVYEVVKKTPDSVWDVMPMKEVVTVYELDGNEVSEIENTYMGTNGFGDSLHITSKTTGGGQTFTKKTVNIYRDDVDKWLVGQLMSSKVEQSCPCMEPVTRHVSYEYDADNGYITSQTVEPDHELALVIDFRYDNTGNVISKTEMPLQNKAQVRRITSTFGDDGIFIKASSNAKGHTEIYEYDQSTGNVLTMTGGNGLNTSWTYDKLGRKLSEFQADGTYITWSYNWDKTIPDATYNIRMQSEGSPTKTKMYDYLDRVVCEQSVGFDGSDVHEDIQYNSEGLIHKHSNPHFVSNFPSWTVYQYDNLRRVTRKEMPAYGDTTAEQKTVYNGLHMTQINSLGYATVIEKDALGQLVKVRDPLSGTVQYKYDPVGNLIQTIGTDDHVTRIQYDLLGNKIKVDDPNMGIWEYKHNAFGELIRQEDANQNILTQEYDNLGRLVKRTELEGTTKWTYDTQTHGVGKLGNVQGPDGYRRTWNYDEHGRENKLVTVLNGQTFETSTKYDQYGRISQQKYPNGEFTYREYTSKGYLLEVGLGPSNTSKDKIQMWTALSYGASGHMETELYGNGLVTDYDYDSASHMVGITTHKDGEGMLRHLHYTYDQNENLHTRKDLKQGIMEMFTYDKLDRLTQSTVVSDDGTYQRRQNWDYESNGNIRFNDVYGLRPFTYHQTKPHAVMKAGNHTYAYDANGNAVLKDGRAIHWTSNNKPSRFVTENGNIMFKYAPDRSRYQKISPGGDNTYYLGKTYELQTKNNISTSKMFIYGAMGRLVAIVSKNMTADSNNSLSYIHTDNLGSIDTVSHENSEVVERMSYDAFGSRRTGNWKMTDYKAENSVRGYTGHEHLPELGLVHMNGRVYDPEIGRFLSPDPHVQDPTNTQALNRYSYALNNPLKHSDPSGYFWKSLKRFVKKFWKPVLAVAVSVLTAGIAAPIAAGLVASAGLSGLAATVAAGSLIGAASGFAGGTVITGNIKGGLQGAVGGAILGGAAAPFGNTWNIQRVLTKATAGGIVSELGGGKFKDGFVQAGVVAGARYLYNGIVQYDVDMGRGGGALEKTKTQRPIAGINNIGVQGKPPDTSWFDDEQFLGVNWGEGGGVSRLLNRIPGVNGVSGIHDVFQVKMDEVFFPGARSFFNVPGMLPAAFITYTAAIDGPGMAALLVDETRKDKR